MDSQTLSSSSAGRYAPSPSGDLHLGNLRTALFAWLFARSEGHDFVMRVEDLDRVQEGAAQRQLDDLASLGMDWDGEVLVQSTRIPQHMDAVQKLRDAGMVYECFCTRKEIQQAVSAPHAAPGAYPGTCRHLTDAERQERRQVRPPALRLAADTAEFTVYDRFAGDYMGAVDDFVLVRNDGKPAYNLAVVVDDGFQNVQQVVRGDDLLFSAPRQAYLATLLGIDIPEYVHVPLALNTEGKRLAKRDGAVTLAQLRAGGVSTAQVMRMIAASMPLAPWRGEGGPHLPETAQQMLEVFNPDTISREPWTVIPTDLESICCG
ncbi:tRNA glutamyl-Q(34) synthetase GluQRS [Rothia terrae]|uniref:tRNA glutamyl-Q(34) synthetase GluQRS n=1 Tax=Rothia terrae TaxID=396015 RepID=UPI002881C94C|nr:tRNA glutamyl-Q(34) synthetase GluQRS [Rothia terrae]MDT0189896.1 tRNA glutamyl-Q(34) synthetase GluQRS [Rothia terrae]